MKYAKDGKSFITDEDVFVFFSVEFASLLCIAHNYGSMRLCIENVAANSVIFEVLNIDGALWRLLVSISRPPPSPPPPISYKFLSFLRNEWIKLNEAIFRW